MKVRKVALITGASGGIGQATAMAFVAAGYNVCLTDINIPTLEAVAAEIKEKHKQECLIIPGDLSDSSFWSSLVEKLYQTWGRIDVLVNNAAWRTLETMRTISLKTWEDTMRVCLTAPAFLSKYCAEKMESSGKGGVIINVSSVMSDRPGGTSPAYITSKGGIESLTKELSITYGRSGIRVLALKPGYIDSDLSKDYKDEAGRNLSQELSDNLLQLTPLDRAGSPEEVAETILWLSSEKAAYFTGTCLVMDGGLENNFNSYALKHLQFPKEF